MSEKLEQIEKILTCAYCHKIFACPVILPCGDRICQAHLQNKASLKCLVCFEEITRITPDLPVDKLLLDLIDLNLFSNVFIGADHKRAIEAFKKLEMLVCDSEKLIHDPYFHLYETISQVRNEIDMKNELQGLENYVQLHAELDKFETERKDMLGFNNQFYLTELQTFKQ